MGRQEWDAILRDEVGVKVLPGEKFQPRKRETRGDVEKRERRQKSRRWTAYAGLDALQRKIEARLERLECTNYGDSLIEGELEEDGGDSDDYEMSEDGSESDSDSDEVDDNYKLKKKPKSKAKKAAPKKKAPLKRKASGTGEAGSAKKGKSKKKKKMKVEAKVKKNRVRGLGDILIDENRRKMASATTIQELDAPDYNSARAPKSRYPANQICVVTGLLAPYKDPESGLNYSNITSYEKLKEQPPSWVKASASAPFHDALRVAAEERSEKRRKLQDIAIVN